MFKEEKYGYSKKQVLDFFEKEQETVKCLQAANAELKCEIEHLKCQCAELKKREESVKDALVLLDNKKNC